MVERDANGKDLSPLSTAACHLVPCHPVLEVRTSPKRVAVLYLSEETYISWRVYQTYA